MRIGGYFWTLFPSFEKRDPTQSRVTCAMCRLGLWMSEVRQITNATAESLLGPCEDSDERSVRSCRGWMHCLADNAFGNAIGNSVVESVTGGANGPQGNGTVDQPRLPKWKRSLCRVKGSVVRLSPNINLAPNSHRAVCLRSWWMISASLRLLKRRRPSLVQSRPRKSLSLPLKAISTSSPPCPMY